MCLRCFQNFLWGVGRSFTTRQFLGLLWRGSSPFLKAGTAQFGRCEVSLLAEDGGGLAAHRPARGGERDGAGQDGALRGFIQK